MTFAEPQYAWLLFLLPVIALLKIFADARAQRAVEAFAASERLRKNLLGGASVVWSGLHFGLQLLGLGFLIIAMTQPKWGIIQDEVKESGRNIFIAIDTSKSMLTEDVKPNRLTRAKLAAMDMLEKLPGDRVGLIAFAGRAFLQAPLTTDHDAVRESIQALDHSTIPRGGSSVAAAIKLALETTEKMGKVRNGMILFTDGQETDDATIEAAREAAERQLLILPVGVGTAQGDVIPDPDPEAGNNSGYVVDSRGNVVSSRLESGMLKEVAQITNGEYIALSSQALTQSIVSRLTNNLQRHEAGARKEDRHAERYQWPLAAGILCMVLSLFMRPSSRKRVKMKSALPVDPQAAVHVRSAVPVAVKSAAVSALMLFVLVQGVAAAVPENEEQERLVKESKDLLQKMKDKYGRVIKEQAMRAPEEYHKGNYEFARIWFYYLLDDKENRFPKDELAYALGATELKLGDEAHAISAFSRSLQSKDEKLQLKSLKALGNVLYEKGAKEREAATKALKERKQAVADEAIKRTLKDWEDALAHLGTALQKDPGHKPTHENYDFVKKQIEDLKREAEEQKKQQQQQQQQDQQQEGEKGEKNPEGKGEGEGDPQSQGEGGKDRESKEQDAMQNGKQEVPEGQVSADQSSKEEQEGQAKGEKQGQQANAEKEAQMREGQRNEETGFSPMEARSQLRNYADDQNSVQYLMRREQPEGGKDY